MKDKPQIVEDWLPRYTGVPRDQFGKYILLTNFSGYLGHFARLMGARGFDPSWPATFVYDHAKVRVWADAAAATGNAVYPLGVRQIVTEQDE